jgi:hypothetical protein
VVPDGAVPPEVDETATELVDDRAWWERIWDFVTGGDLADDG